MSFKLKNLKKLENNKVLLELEISNSYLKKSFILHIRTYPRSAKIPGFRPGKYLTMLLMQIMAGNMF